MQTKEEIITAILKKWGVETLYGQAVAIQIWNDAIDMAADHAQAFIGTDNHGQDIPIVSKGSITDLKFKDR